MVPAASATAFLKSLAADAVEDGVHSAKRTLKTIARRMPDAADMRDEVVHRIKREPIKAIGIAMAAGVAVGLAVGLAVDWIGRGARRGRGQTVASPWFQRRASC